LPLPWFLGMPSATQAVTITLSVNGYSGGNYLSDGTTVFPSGTKVKLGFFYSGSSFQSVSSVNSTWTGFSASDTLATKLTNLGSNFYTIAETTSVLDADLGPTFQLLWHVNSDAIAGAAPGALVTSAKFETLLSTPGVGSGSFDVKGQNAFVWIETASRNEFGLFASKGLFPTVADEDWALDVISASATDAGVTAIAGTASASGVTLIPEPASGSLLLFGLGLLAATRKKILSSLT